MNAASPNWDNLFRRLRAYIALGRFDRPIGGWFVTFPCWWGATLGGATFTHSFWIYFVLWIGAFFMRGAGCVFNDYLDRDVDRFVERTKNRPLASGEISPRNGLIYFALLCLPGLWVLTQLPWRCVWLAPVGLSLLLIYPLAKRYTHWAQAVLGLAFSHGVLFGFATQSPLSLSWYSFIQISPIYLASILWVIAYDTIYAVQDRSDDEKIGVKSTARLFGHHVKEITSILYAGSLFLILWQIMNQAEKLLYPLLLWSLTTMATTYHLYSWDPHITESCSRAFHRAQWYGWLVLGIVHLL